LFYTAEMTSSPGQHDLVWAVDLVGNGVNTYTYQSLVIDAASFPGRPSSIMSEIEAILASLEVGHWG
jgi:hypothetical protein